MCEFATKKYVIADTSDSNSIKYFSHDTGPNSVYFDFLNDAIEALNNMALETAAIYEVILRSVDSKILLEAKIDTILSDLTLEEIECLKNRIC